eukprot:Tamp_17983.p1 GENE.Tamp_17983~~Tamp_17983.p1  ORF type:complete len:452 (-),score=43.28 Tamp_17983:2-1255(-)
MPNPEPGAAATSARRGGGAGEAGGAVAADWLGTWYTVVGGDTLTDIANRHHVPMPGILALNTDSVQSADTINVGQRLRIPSEKDARRLAGLGPEPPACNFAINPSFEEAADGYGLALAAVDAKLGRLAVAWKGLDAVSPGPHYVRDTAIAHSGSSSMRMQCLDACAQGKGWLGVYQHIPVKYAEPSDELLATFWVAAEGLTQGAGVYLDASYSAVVSQTRTNTSPYGAPRSVSGVRAAGASGASGGGSKLWASGQWGERPAAFVKDLTAHIPEGTYGWWPLSIRVPAGASVGDRGAETVPRRPLMLTMFVLMRGARGTLWMDSLSVSPSRAPTAPYGIAQVMPSIKPLQSLPRSLLQAARARASLSPGSEDGYAAERRPELAGSWLGLPGTGTSHVATGRFLESALANVRGGSEVGS